MKKKRFDKKAIALSFNWIFALVVGGVVLFLAIYGAGKFIETGERTISTETAASIVSLFDPETGLASGIANKEFKFKKQSKIFFDCDESFNAPFGRQRIYFSEQSFGKEYGEISEKVPFYNRHVFADKEVEGKSFYIFSKPFFMGFKVTDIIIIDSKNYCFYNAPEDFKDELDEEGLDIKQLVFLNSSSEKCEGVSVCFNTNKNCEIKVSESGTYVEKNGVKTYYVENLIYGAIFSSPEIYECNLKRIKNRFDELVKIYVDKISIIERQNCYSKIRGKLLEAEAIEIENSRDFVQRIYPIVEDYDSINQLAKDGCELYHS